MYSDSTMIRNRDPSAAIVTPAMSCTRSTIARPIPSRLLTAPA
jgi:hypothetical protein